MSGHPIIVFGGSAGGIDALRQIVKAIPPTISASVLVVVHLYPKGQNYLPSILAREGRIPAHLAIDGCPIRPNHIYVAPSDTHLLVEDGYLRLSKAAKENGSRPAIDPLFRSVAQNYGSQAVGIILSGLLDDGTSGLHAIKRAGGIAVIQDPQDAAFPDMPQNAQKYVDVDYCVPASKIGPLLTKLTERIRSRAKAKKKSRKESEMKTPIKPAPVGRPAYLSCPICNGTLNEVEDGKIFRFQCYMGHRLSPQALLEQQGESLERTLWVAFRALEDRLSLLRRVAKSPRSLPRVSSELKDRIKDTEKHVEILGRLLQVKLETNPKSKKISS
jgi:two-component system, chemotaxis family, protein-glutamate methylesterase/glutaminase